MILKTASGEEAATTLLSRNKRKVSKGAKGVGRGGGGADTLHNHTMCVCRIIESFDINLS